MKLLLHVVILLYECVFSLDIDGGFLAFFIEFRILKIHFIFSGFPRIRNSETTRSSSSQKEET